MSIKGVVISLPMLLLAGCATGGDGDTVPLSAVFSCYDFPPRMIKDNADQNPGFQVELINAVMGRIGTTVEYTYASYDEARSLAKSDDVIGLCNCEQTLENNDDFVFTIAFEPMSSGVFSLNDDSHEDITSLSQLSSQHTGYMSNRRLRKSLMSNGVMDTEEITSASLGLRLLAAETFDYLYAYEEPIRAASSKLHVIPDLAYSEISNTSASVCISRQNPQSKVIRDAFNKALMKVKRDGTYDAILEKYRDNIQ